MHRKKYLLLGLVLSIFIFGENACGKSLDTLLVVFSANTNGQLLDCGCAAEVAGGLPRRLTVINQLRQQYGDILLVDGGDYFATTNRQLQNSKVLESYKMMNYDAIALGDQEFWNGLDIFEEKIVKSDLPILSTNFHNNYGTKIKPVLSLKKQGYFLQLFAIVHPESFGFFPEEQLTDINWKDAEKSLKENLKTEKNQLNLVVFHGDRHILDKMIKNYPEVGIWLVAHQEKKMESDWQKLNKPVVVYSDSDGESVQLLKAFLNDDSTELEFTTKRLRLTEDILPDQNMKQFIDQYYDDLKQTLLSQKRLNSLGSCRQCHLLEYEAWHKSSHAKSMEVVNKSEEKNKKDCKKCHASEWGDFISCSSCHQISKNHSEWGVKDKTAVNISKKCSRCHTKKDHPDFAFSKHWPKITH